MAGVARPSVLIFPPRDETWRADAACLGKGPEPWYPPRGAQVAAQPIKAICQSCPVRLDCLDYALARREQWGIWGGLTIKGRLRVQRALKTGISLRQAVTIEDVMHPGCETQEVAS